MAERRRYTTRTRAKAVGIAVVDGVTAAAEQTGIPRKTIEYWIDKPEFAELRQKSRGEVADQFWAAIQVGLKEVAEGLKGDAPLRDKSVALGILWDKHALMTGDVTGRTESRELNDLPDSALREALHLVPDGEAGVAVEAAEKAAG